MINPYNFLPGNLDESVAGVNSMGYRAPEFDTVDWANSIVIFGCSFVYGTAINDNETISAQLENLLGRPVINMGVPASSMIYAFANQLSMREQNILPYAVVNCWTSINRLSYFLDNDVVAHIGPWTEKANTKNLNLRVYKKLLELWNFEDSNAKMYSSIFSRMTRLLWEDTKHLEYSFFESTIEHLNVKLIKQIDFGTDNSHPGVRTTAETAKMIKEDLEGN
jgi:hypothetical protein